MTARDRTGSDSRCCTESGAPYNWIHIEETGHPQYIAIEAWLDAMTDTVRAIEEEEIEELFEAASAGKLEDSGDNFSPIKPVTHIPEIFELRRRSTATKPRVYLRFYHCEPPALPSSLIGLHRHIKTSDDDQTDALAQAIKQHSLGNSIGWAP